MMNYDWCLIQTTDLICHLSSTWACEAFHYACILQECTYYTSTNIAADEIDLSSALDSSKERQYPYLFVLGLLYIVL
jgi:hypothetical protein